MTRVLLDANFLVLPFQEPVDIFSELDRLLGRYEVYTLNRTYNEALDLADGKYRDRVERLVAETDIEIVSVAAEQAVDDLLVDLAGEYVVCTNDADLQQRLAEQDRPYIRLRQHDHLEGANLERFRV